MAGNEAGRLVPDLFLFLFKKFYKRGKSKWSVPWLYKTWLYAINWPNFMVCMPLLFEILVNTCTVIVCFPGHDVINFEINLPVWPKNPVQKFKYLQNKKCFLGKIKSIFHHFKRRSIARNCRNCLRSVSAPLGIKIWIQ